MSMTKFSLAISLVSVAAACGRPMDDATLTSAASSSFSGTYRLNSLSDCQGSYTSTAVLPSERLDGGSLGDSGEFILTKHGQHVSIAYHSTTLGGDINAVLASENPADMRSGRRSSLTENQIKIDDNFASIRSGIFVDHQSYLFEQVDANTLKVSVSVDKKFLFGLNTKFKQICTFQKI